MIGFWMRESNLCLGISLVRSGTRITKSMCPFRCRASLRSCELPYYRFADRTKYGRRWGRINEKSVPARTEDKTRATTKKNQVRSAAELILAPLPQPPRSRLPTDLPAMARWRPSQGGEPGLFPASLLISLIMLSPAAAVLQVLTSNFAIEMVTLLSCWLGILVGS